MLSEYQKFQTRRWWRRKVRKALKFWKNINVLFRSGINQPIKKNFVFVRRFVIGWIVIISLMVVGITLQSQQLDSAYKKSLPKQGGAYTEGMVGELSNLNPIFASGDVNQAASRLIFSGLFEYDRSGDLQPNLAKDIEIDKSGLKYTVNLRQDVTWHDGDLLDAKDVVYTFKTIQNPATPQTPTPQNPQNPKK